MPETRHELRFLLNKDEVVLDDLPASRTLLDHLRLDRKLRGTKEGCAEGDCGACTVLVGRLLNGELIYETVNSCIRFLGSLDGCHVVTIEHLKGADGELHPVQEAMVAHHGSQCGFCTPGIVMSLYALWMRNPSPSNGEIERALQGNLCRCTGYEPIVQAARAASSTSAADDPLVRERAAITARLLAMKDGKRVRIQAQGETLMVPADSKDLAAALADHPGATIVSGSTDVGLWVTKHFAQISPAIFIGHLDSLHRLRPHTDGILAGACVTYTEFERAIDRQFPAMRELWNRIGGDQVRNMGTIGGNIANGSPIGDTPPALIALGAKLILQSASGKRELPLEDFFIAYGKQDLRDGEFVREIFVPYLGASDIFGCYKLSKRRDEDISSVCAAFRITLEGGRVAAAHIAYGGMAATPKRAARTEAALKHAEWNEESIRTAMKAMADDFSPMSDHRASAEYRMKTAANLLLRFYLENSGLAARLQRAVA